MPFSSLRLLVASLLWPTSPVPPLSLTAIDPPPPTPNFLRFTLRHEHALTNASRVVFRDVPLEHGFASSALEMGTALVRVHRPASANAFQRARYARWRPQDSFAEDLRWDDEEVEGPNVTSRVTLQTLAKMSNNAYYDWNTTAKGWYDLGRDWSTGYPVGWEPDADGFRGHVFASEDNATVVLAIKGTSAGWLVGGGGPTVRKDKINDNLLFSCCCARVGPTWTTVCGCHSGGYKCDEECLERSLIDDSLFYPVGINLYNNITYLYPNARIWLTGHSLGGSLASLIGLTFGAPTVAFEAPAEKLAAKRLHLPSPPSTQHITHIYHTADPIPQGTCTGVSSACALGGYALETRCHLGRVIRYDTVTKHGWSVDIRTHGIQQIVDRLLAEDWEPALEGTAGREVPDYFEEEDCMDCFNWEYGKFKNTTTKAWDSGTCSLLRSVPLCRS